MPVRRGYHRRRRHAARRIQRAFRGKRRVVKRTTTRKLALINRRMFKKADDKVECKYVYQGWNQLRCPPARAPVANGTMSTYPTWSTQLLTGILPISGQAFANTAMPTRIPSGTRRIGKDVYITGIHVKLWFEFPSNMPAATTIRPPWCDCHAVIVREKQNGSHNPAPSASQYLPDNNATVKVPTTVSVFDTLNDTAVNPQQGNLLWKNMQSGQNYIVAAHKKVRISGFPTLNGNAPDDDTSPLPYANSAKYMDFHYHPKCKVEYNTPLLANPAATPTTSCPQVYRLVGQKNNVYLLFWSVTPVPPTGFVYSAPLCSGNTVTRFTDS